MRSVFVILFSLFMVAVASASPMAPQPELEIEGLIAAIEWVPETTEKGVWV